MELPDSPEPLPGQMQEPTAPDPTDRGRRAAPLLRTALAAVVVVGVLIVGLAALLGRTPDPPVADAAAGATPTARGAAPETLPDARLGTFDGQGEVPVADFLGGPPLVVNFWATWCAPCVAEMPDLQRLHEAADGRVLLVGVNTQDSPVNARPFAEELGISYPLVTDPRGDYYRATGSFGMPTTLFVTPDGQVRWRHTGPLTLEQMGDLVAEHLDVTVDLGPVGS